MQHARLRPSSFISPTTLNRWALNSDNPRIRVYPYHPPSLRATARFSLHRKDLANLEIRADAFQMKECEVADVVRIQQVNGGHMHSRVMYAGAKAVGRKADIRRRRAVIIDDDTEPCLLPVRANPNVEP
jgi:hypothetical protein